MYIYNEREKKCFSSLGLGSTPTSCYPEKHSCAWLRTDTKQDIMIQTMTRTANTNLSLGRQPTNLEAQGGCPARPEGPPTIVPNLSPACAVLGPSWCHVG